MGWLDHAVVVAYLAGMLVLGVVLSRRQHTDEEYFLGGRRMPWLAVGMSVIASLLSSLTYLSEPGEVWNSGMTHVVGKMLAIPFEMAIVWLLCIPFLMRFRYTSAYEYLEHRFAPSARLLGVALFLALVILWMGFVVLASARALATVTGFDLATVIATVGIVATTYTMLGGLRAVIWTDVVQVILLVGGGLFAIGYVAYATGTWLPEWYQTTAAHLTSTPGIHELPFFSFDPTVRATVVTVALSMCVWHVCTHTSNQMTVQRYYSTRDVRAARRSFLVGSLLGVAINLMLVVVGLAMLHYYLGHGVSLDGHLDASVKQDRDLIFPTFAVHRLPPGCGGAILAALLAAAMSSIDSGVNSMATVITVERRRRDQRRCERMRTEEAESANLIPAFATRANGSRDHVAEARWITLAVGTFITVAAYLLDFLPPKWGIVDAMPRTFNAITAPLGGLFLIGMFLPMVGARAAVVATLFGLATSVAMGYWEQIGAQLYAAGLVPRPALPLGFTWIMPTALAVTLIMALLLSPLDAGVRKNLAGLTWFTRHEPPPHED